MPLVIPKLNTITNLNELLGRLYINEAIPVPPKILENENLYSKDDGIDPEKVVFSSQLPKNVVVVRQNMNNIAIKSVIDSGMVPIIVDEESKIIKIIKIT